MDRNTRNLSSKTKKHLEEYNKMMASKRISKLQVSKEPQEPKYDSELEKSIDISIKIESKHDTSSKNQDHSSTIELSQFNISQQ